MSKVALLDFEDRAILGFAPGVLSGFFKKRVSSVAVWSSFDAQHCIIYC